jgi:hypothetical protein
VSGNAAKVYVGGQHCQVVAEAELREQCVDRADLNSAAVAHLFLNSAAST